MTGTPKIQLEIIAHVFTQYCGANGRNDSRNLIFKERGVYAASTLQPNSIQKFILRII